MKTYDIAVIGGGASGLMAAATAGQSGKSVVVLEGNQKLGKKLLATGNGRCNLSNLHVSVSHYHGDSNEIGVLLAHYSPEKIEAEFKKLGLLLFFDEEGRAYPSNMQAAAVLRVLMENCEERGVDCLCDFNTFSAVRGKDEFILKSGDGREIRARRVILATGGRASPKHSSGKDGYRIASLFGHSTTDLYPALTQFTTGDPFVQPLSGVRCKARVSLFGDGRELCAENGEILFADKAVSGICIFGLSIYGSEFFALGTVGAAPYKSLNLQLDFCPHMEKSEILEYLLELAYKRPKMSCGDLLNGLLNLKLGIALIKKAEIDSMHLAGSLTPAEAERLVGVVKGLPLAVNGTKGWQDAQITAGGIPVSEIDLNTMESRRQHGLYIAGELLNIHGDCGGYNLHWAWLTGLIAGKSAADTRILL